MKPLPDKDDRYSQPSRPLVEPMTSMSDAWGKEAKALEDMKEMRAVWDRLAQSEQLFRSTRRSLQQLDKCMGEALLPRKSATNSRDHSDGQNYESDC